MKYRLVNFSSLFFEVTHVENGRSSLSPRRRFPLVLTLVRQQGFVQEFGGRSEMDGDVVVGEVVQLDAHVLDVHAGVEGLAGVDPGAVGGVEDVGDAHALQPSLVYCDGPGGRNSAKSARLQPIRLKTPPLPGRDSLLGDEDVGPHLVGGVGGSLQALLHHGPLDVQHTGGVVGAALVDHVPDAVVQVFHHQLLGRLQHGLRDGLGSHAARRELWRKRRYSWDTFFRGTLRDISHFQLHPLIPLETRPVLDERSKPLSGAPLERRFGEGF